MDSACVSPSMETPDAARCSFACARFLRGRPRQDLRRDLLEPDHARELADFAFLVFAKPHQERHRRPDQFLHFGAVGVDVHLAADDMLRAAQLCAHDVAKRGLDRGPIFDLIRGEPQPALETGNLTVVEQPSSAGVAGGGGGSGFGLSYAAMAAPEPQSWFRRLRFGRFASAAGAGSVTGIEGVAAITGSAGRSKLDIQAATKRAHRLRWAAASISAVWIRAVGLGGAVGNLRFANSLGETHRLIGRHRPVRPLGIGAVSGQCDRGGAENNETNDSAFGQATTPHTVNRTRRCRKA